MPDRVPNVSVEKGTTKDVVLDCPYDVTSDEDASGLAVKWYFENDTSPVYQWIPGNQPQVSPYSGIWGLLFVLVEKILYEIPFEL